MNRAIFLDRDGTIIRDAGYLRDISAIEPLAGALEALRQLRTQGWLIIIVTNQSGVGRRYISMDEMLAVQRAFQALMQSAGADVSATYCCVHAPEEKCDCRKPSPSLFFQAAQENSVDLRQSWMVGDRESDILSGKSAGCSTIWLKNCVHAVDPDLPDFIAENWPEIASIITGARSRIKSDSDSP